MARVDVFDISGRITATPAAGEMTAGEHSVVWDLEDSAGNDAPSGVYFVRISTENWTGSGQLVIAR